MTFESKWGQPSVHLLPSSLGSRWANEYLPTWVANLARIPPRSKIDSLCEPLNEEVSEDDWNRLVKFVLNLVRGRLDSISKVPAVDPADIVVFQPEVIRWSVRTRNCLSDAGLMDDPEMMSHLTFGDLLEIANLGIRSAIEFAVMLEIFMRHTRSQMLDDKVDWIQNEKQKREVLIELAVEDWALLISGKDPRFSELLGGDSVPLSERILNALENDDQKEINYLAGAVDKLRERITEIETHSLEGALLQLFIASAARQEGRITEIIRRFGWDGNAPETLQEVGDRLDITRERVRQIEAKILNALPDHPVFVPSLQKAIDALEENAPISIDQAADLLRAQGISKNSFHPKSVIRAAVDCHIPTTLKIQSVRGKRLVTAKTDESFANRLASFARRQSGASGATNAAEVLEQAWAEGLEFEEERAIRLIENLPDLQWLGDDWFTISSIPIERNRLRNTARKMLSVISPMKVQTIRSGMRKVASWRNSTAGDSRWPFRAPPGVVIRKFLEDHPEFSVDDDDNVFSLEELNYVSELGDGERAFVDAIRSTPGGVLDRQSIRDKCVKRSINQHTVEVLLTYSPVVEHLGVNLWAICGAEVDPATVEAVRISNAEKPRERRVTDYGWTDSGNVWITIVVPSYITSSFVFGVPGGVKRFLVGQRFPGIDHAGRNFGEVVVTDDGTIYGTGKLLNRQGADAGDIIYCEFDISKNSVSVHVGGEELVNNV